MSYAIIGFGKIGQALAKAFARNGIEVSVATTRDPEGFASGATAIGPEIVPKKLGDAVTADIIFLAVRFDSHPDVAKALPSWRGRTIVDVANAFGVPPEELGGQPSSKAVAKAFAGGRLVKGIWPRGSSTSIRRHMVAGESCSWRVTTTPPLRRLVRLPKIWACHQSNSGGFRKADCSCRRAETLGVG